MSGKKRDELIISSNVPVSVILSYGLFGVFVTGYYFVKTVSNPSILCCRSAELMNYFNTLPTLLWTLSALLAAVSLQAIYLILKYEPIDEVPRFSPLGWLFGHTFLQALPFFLMMIAQFALPNYFGTYFYSGVIVLAIFLILGKHFGKYKLNFIAFDVPRHVKIRRWSQAVLLVSFIFLILFIILPSCIGREDRSNKIASTKSNMHSLQTMLENYAVDWGGVYPPTIQALEKESKGRGYYWKSIMNPCSRATETSRIVIPIEQGNFIRSIDVLGFRFDLERGWSRCMVLYRRTSETRYEITGTDVNGRLIQDFDKAFLLSNE